MIIKHLIAWVLIGVDGKIGLACDPHIKPHFSNINVNIKNYYYFQIKSIKVVTDDKRILKHIMIDILNLRNGMEDNLLLIQQINLMIQKEGEEQKGLDDLIHAAQQHIDSINSIYTLGVSWLKDDTDYVVNFRRGKPLLYI